MCKKEKTNRPPQKRENFSAKFSRSNEFSFPFYRSNLLNFASSTNSQWGEKESICTSSAIRRRISRLRGKKNRKFFVFWNPRFTSFFLVYIFSIFLSSTKDRNHFSPFEIIKKCLNSGEVDSGRGDGGGFRDKEKSLEGFESGQCWYNFALHVLQRLQTQWSYQLNYHLEFAQMKCTIFSSNN